MKLLITGGAGFIGSNAASYFADKGHEIIVLDNLLSGYYDNIKGLVNNKKCTFIEGDVRDSGLVKKIFSEHRIDVCINYAALVSVIESTENPLLTEDINVNGMLNLLEQAGKNKIKVFIHASSAAVYGEGEELPKRESMALEPISPYAITKLAGEYYNNFYAATYGFTAVNCRFFNVFGPRQDPDSQYAAAIPIFLKRSISNSSITIFGDGEQTRDFVYVNDLISAKDFLIEAGLNGRLPYNTFNIGYGSFITINELVGKITEHVGTGSEILYGDPRPGEIKYSYASVDRLKDLGWRPQTGFEKGLNNTINWFKEIL